ncbi:MAG: DUF3037 domain-containing protein [Acidobacteriota bacterium]|nr:DUF3037 domain-containing protein [Acidobacteriota bacterium]
MPSSFDYVVIRIVPLVEREEFFNAGVILFCPQQKFLSARVYLDEKKLTVLAPELDLENLQRRLEGIQKICAGDQTAGPIAQLSQRARFHWLVAPRSTIVQVSPAHSGICEEPEAVLNRLFNEQVLPATALDSSG